MRKGHQTLHPQLVVEARALRWRIGTFNGGDVRFREVAHANDAAIAALEAVIILSGEHTSGDGHSRDHHGCVGHILIAPEILLEFGGRDFHHILHTHLPYGPYYTQDT